MFNNRTVLISYGINLSFLLYGIVLLMRQHNEYSKNVVSKIYSMPTTPYEFKLNFGAELFSEFSTLYFELTKKTFTLEKQFMEKFLSNLPTVDRGFEVLLHLLEKLLIANYHSAVDRKLQREQVLEVSRDLTVEFQQLGLDNFDEYNELEDLVPSQGKIALTEVYMRRQALNYESLRRYKRKELLEMLKLLQKKWQVMYDGVPEQHLLVYPEYKRIDELFQKIKLGNVRGTTFVILNLFKHLDNFFEYQIKLSQD